MTIPDQLMQCVIAIQDSLEREQRPPSREALIAGFTKQLQAAGFRVTENMLRILCKSLGETDWDLGDPCE